MVAGTLYTYPNNFRAYKAQIAAAYSGANVKVASQPPEFKFGETNKSEAFLQKFPTGKVPAFEGDDGVVLFGSSAIAYYLSNDELHGKNPKDAASILQWIEFAENEILPASCTWVFPCLGAMQFNKQATEKAKGDVKNALQILNNFLLSRTYLVGERISLADISVCCNLLQLFQLVLDPEFRKPYQNVLRWFTTLVNQPEFKSVLGDFEMCKKMAQFDAKKFAEVQGGGSKKEKPEKKQEKKQQQPKQEKKAKKDSNPDEVPDFPEEKKAKDPFMQLPAMNFNMDEWKKTYSNKDTATVAVPYFWEKFDKENMSIWFSEYLYPDELEMIFMSCNLVSGMFQRLDKMRKHAFASVGIFGEDNNCSISGIWVWRGQGLAFELSEDLQIDYESYKWTKLDPDNDETKKMVNEYLLWEGDFGGKNFNQGKVYK